MKTWRAKVRIGGSSTEVQVQAQSYFDAKRILEAQYGTGTIAFGPTEAR